MENKLKKLREKNKISQEKLARIVDVSSKTIYRIEKTKNTDVQTALKIAKALNSKVEDIFN